MIGDNFALVGKENSVACRKARALGPYDVVNLDLCDGFGAQAPQTIDNSYYDAVSSLLTLQARSTSAWLLLLTTRADRRNIDVQTLEALVGKYINNLNTCQTFQEASQEKFGIADEVSLRQSLQSADGLLSIFLTGLCKWIVGLSLAQQPPTSVELRSVIGYRVDDAANHEDLISLAFRFTPTFIPPPDPLGLAAQSGNALSECILSTRAIKKVAKRVNVDQKLIDDQALHQSMIDATAQLLELARYDTIAYRDWAVKSLTVA